MRVFAQAKGPLKALPICMVSVKVDKGKGIDFDQHPGYACWRGIEGPEEKKGDGEDEGPKDGAVEEKGEESAEQGGVRAWIRKYFSLKMWS